MRYLFIVPYQGNPQVFANKTKWDVIDQLAESEHDLDDLHYYWADGKYQLQYLLERTRREEPHQWAKLVELIELEIECLETELYVRQT